MTTLRDTTRTNVAGLMNDIEKRHEKLKQRASQGQTEKNLLNQVAQWEKESIGKIQTAAKKARTEIQQFIKDSNIQITNSLNKVSSELRTKKRANNYTDRDIENLNNLLQSCGEHMKQQNELNVIKKDFSPSELIKVAKNFAPTQEMNRPTTRGTRFAPTRDQQPLSPRLERYSLPPEIGFLSERPAQRVAEFNTLPPPQFNPTPQTRRRPIENAPNSRINSDPYPSISFNVNSGTDKNIQRLFESIGTLAPMNKLGPMSGDCDYETTQMESFLAQTFQFRNIPGEYIVHGVKSFRLGRPPFLMDPNTLIRFPGTGRVAFAMTAQEITDWQKSYRVYADEDALCINKIFIRRALQGLTKSGEEAFAMKFVVRISQCPILMEFDARVIQRELQHDWPQRIKLVSVTGIDFAGRVHDLNDITTYVANWTDVYEIDPRTGLPYIYNGRDFRVKARAPRAQLQERQLLADLMRMARLRLYACDKEQVQVVVETGIGLGVFAGKHIGIDGKVRALSARAIRQVLEEDGSLFQNICAVVFALPIFESDVRNGRRDDVYQAFADEFNTSQYKGRIPVLIADQDMHRLAVWIAMSGYRVSELNPADSHGVFGEYWQNRGPAVEEKLALTTVGLLVQHHLINPHVLDMDHYHLVSFKT